MFGQKVRVDDQFKSRSSANQGIGTEIVVIDLLELHKEPKSHLQLGYVVRRSLTGEDIRHATVEF